MSSPSVYEPLFVNTDIEYKLDSRLFPGIDDPRRAMEPKLLIHSERTCGCFTCNTADVDLYELIDSCTNDESDVPDIPVLNCIDDFLNELEEETDELIDEDDSIEPTTPELPPYELAFLLEEVLHSYVDMSAFPCYSNVGSRKRKCSYFSDIDDVPYKRICVDSVCSDGFLDDTHTVFSSESMCRGS